MFIFPLKNLARKGLLGVSQGYISKILQSNRYTSRLHYRNCGGRRSLSTIRKDWQLIWCSGTIVSFRLLVCARRSPILEEVVSSEHCKQVSGGWLSVQGFRQVPGWLWITGNDAVCEGERTEGGTSGTGGIESFFHAVSQWWWCSCAPQGGLVDASIQTTAGSYGLSIIVWCAIHHGGRVNWCCWINPSTDSATSCAMASLVTTSRMQQCFNVLIDIYHEFLLLFYCCVLLEIKLTTTTTSGFSVIVCFLTDACFWTTLLYAQDNASPQIAREMTDFLALEDVEVMDWPAWSPDMKPIGHVLVQMLVWIWDMYHP